MSYKAKYKITSDESLKEREVLKIANNIDKHEENRIFWQIILPSALIFAFSIVALCLLITPH